MHSLFCVELLRNRENSVVDVFPGTRISRSQKLIYAVAHQLVADDLLQTNKSFQQLKRCCFTNGPPHIHNRDQIKCEISQRI